MRTFTMFRRNVPDATHNENQKNAPDQPQFEGVQFSDGGVAIRWLTAKRSTAVWASMEDMLAIHGHPEYGSELVWHDGAGVFSPKGVHWLGEPYVAEGEVACGPDACGLVAYFATQEQCERAMDFLSMLPLPPEAKAA